MNEERATTSISASIRNTRASRRMSWVSPRMTSASSASAPPPSTSSASSSAAPQQDTDAPAPPETPASVPNLHAGLCRDVVRFRHFLSQYRALDDRITSLLNRTLASSRDAGRNLPPSLLLPLPSPSSSPLIQQHADAGVSTYARTDLSSCAMIWDQLVRVWSGREESVRFCLGTTTSYAAPASSPQSRQAPSYAADGDELARLDADRSGAVPLPSARPSESESGRRARKTRDRDAERDPEHWRGAEEDGWRGKVEAEEEALARRLHNELVVDQILRRRSKEVFRSRCPTFQPPDPQRHLNASATVQLGVKGANPPSSEDKELLERSWKYWREP